AVLVDRLEGGKENLATIGVNLSSYASIKNLLQALRQMKLAKSSQVKAILEQAGAHRRAQKAIGSP
ncbi:MAG: hypothetical protein ABSB29_09755, partial [Nitrososphaerales archaeon]